MSAEHAKERWKVVRVPDTHFATVRDAKGYVLLECTLDLARQVVAEHDDLWAEMERAAEGGE